MPDRNQYHFPTRRDLLRIATVSVVGQAGCIYSLRAPYDTSIKTVYIPMFQSDTFHRELAQKMTELVIKEMEKRTPYKHVDSREAGDTILEGSVTYADKNTNVENPQNLPRQLTATIQVAVNWIHNPPLDFEKDRPPTIVSETVNFSPEVGETSMTAFYKTCQNIATQIVDMMEVAWSSNHE